MKQQSILDSARDRRIKVKYSWIMQVLLVLNQFGNVLVMPWLHFDRAQRDMLSMTTLSVTVLRVTTK